MPIGTEQFDKKEKDIFNWDFTCTWENPIKYAFFFFWTIIVCSQL